MVGGALEGDGGAVTRVFAVYLAVAEVQTLALPAWGSGGVAVGDIADAEGRSFGKYACGGGIGKSGLVWA